MESFILASSLSRSSCLLDSSPLHQACSPDSTEASVQVISKAIVLNQELVVVSVAASGRVGWRGAVWLVGSISADRVFLELVDESVARRNYHSCV